MEKFNENIQQLFNKAKNAPPPLSRDEAEVIITSYKKAATVSSFITSAKGILLLVAAAAALCLAYIAVQGIGSHVAGNEQTHENAAEAKTAARENELSPEKITGAKIAVTNGDKNNIPGNNTDTVLKGSGENAGKAGREPIWPGLRNKKTGQPGGDKEDNDKLENEPYSNKPATVGAGSEKDTYEEPGVIRAIAQPEPEEAVADTALGEEELADKKADRERDFVVAQPLARRNFIKTDLAGYFYGLATPYKSIPRTKFSIAYERMLTRHLSAGVGFSMGPIWPGQAGSGSFTDNNGNWMFEQAKISKGWSLNLDARYYFGWHGTSRGFFAGIYYNHTAYADNTYYRAFRDKSSKPGFSVINSSKGNWNVYGISAGYRFLPGGRFIVEPVIGLAQGVESFSYKPSVIISAYRFELNIGYAF